jgi:hypothetical protein
MRLNESNYFSTDAGAAYMSASQLKRFLECEALALAELAGETVRETTTALLVGSYVDAHFSGCLEQFIATHPELYTNKGELRADYRQAQDIIAYMEADPLLMRMLDGEHQRIVTGEIYGVPFKGKIDSLLTSEQCRAIADDYPGMAEDLMMADGAIVDLKIMRDMEAVWPKGGSKTTFVTGWRYDLQMAIYQKLIGKELPCYLVVATKEKPPNKELVVIHRAELKLALEEVEDLIPRFYHLKQHPETASRCKKCAWCRQTKVITGAVDADELEGAGL